MTERRNLNSGSFAAVMLSHLLDRLAATDRPMAALAMNSGLMLWFLYFGGSPDHGRHAASEAK